jgi:hypothetical protein
MGDRMSELIVDPDLDAAAEPETVPAPASRVRYGVLAFACALAVVTYIHRIGFINAAPEMKATGWGGGACSRPWCSAGRS